MKRTLLLSAILLLVAVSAFFIVRNAKSHIKTSYKEKEKEHEPEGKDADGFGDAAIFLNKLRANQSTGIINFNDYYKAIADANTYLSRPATRGANLQWEEMGPDNVGGRTRAIIFDKQNPGWVFAGAVSGGLWYSQTNGSSWNKVPGFNNFGSYTVSALAQGEDGAIYFGTGERFAYLAGIDPPSGAAGFPGQGIWRSPDHGQTWTHIATVNLPSGTGISTDSAFTFVMHLTSGGSAYPNRMYACIYGSSKRTGIIYWDTNLNAWVNTKGFTAGSGTGWDVEVGSDGVVYAIAGGNISGSKYYRSTDGVNFTAATIPGVSNSNRVELSVSPANPAYVYAISSYLPSGASYGELQGVYKSTDDGVTWTTIAPAGVTGSQNWEPVTQGEYALAITAWPGDKDVVFIGGIDCYKGVPNANASLGYDWFKISDWEEDPTSSSYVHADIHRFVFDPTNYDNMFVSCDGGLSYTTNAQVSYPTFGTRNLQYNVTQFYACAGRPYTGEILAGAQDNGNIYVNFDGNTVQSGQLVKGGDGGDVALSYKNPQAMFAEYVFGTVQRSSNNGTTFSNFFDSHIDCQPTNASGQCSGDGMPDEGAPFIAPILLWENPNPNANSPVADSGNVKFFLGTNASIWMTPGALDFSTDPQWFKIASPNAGAFVSLAVAADGSVVYGGTDAGNLYRVTGLDSSGFDYALNGTTYPASSKIKMELIGSFPNRAITSISVDVQNPNHVVCSLGNYGNPDYVYETDSAATGIAPVTFKLIQGTGLPLMPVYSVFIDHQNPASIVIGTELGIYTTTNDGQQWAEDTLGGINRVPVFKLRSVPVGGQENVLYASTYGRGVFRTFSLAYTGVNNVQPAVVKGVNVYPDPATNEVYVSMTLPFTGSSVELNVFDIAGRHIKTINEGRMGPGTQIVQIPANDLSNGTYLLNIRTDNGQTNSKFIILK